VPEEELIRTAVRSLGLADVSPFDPRKKIIEYQFEEPAKSLVRLTLREFANELSTDSPAPGGGSVAALCGALSAALAAMVANLTVGKKGYETAQKTLKRAALRAQELKDEYLRLVDLDTEAFTKVMEALRLPKSPDGQSREREAALEQATKEATSSRSALWKEHSSCSKLAKKVVDRGNRNSLSDAAMAAWSARTAAEGAYYNVRHQFTRAPGRGNSRPARPGRPPRCGGASSGRPAKSAAPLKKAIQKM